MVHQAAAVFLALRTAGANIHTEPVLLPNQREADPDRVLAPAAVAVLFLRVLRRAQGDITPRIQHHILAGNIHALTGDVLLRIDHHRFPCRQVTALLLLAAVVLLLFRAADGHAHARPHH